jgi:hypothetical protein
MSNTANAIKNSLLVVAMILLLHVTAKRQLMMTSPPPPLPTRSPQTRPAEVDMLTEHVRPTEPTEHVRPTEPTERAPGVSPDGTEADVLAYVFGTTTAASPAKDAVAQRSASVMDNNASHLNHMVIGTYQNETALCGGKVFEGNDTVEAFDGVESAFQSLGA